MFLFLLLLFLLYSARHQRPNASCTNEVCELRYKPLLDHVTNFAFIACVFVCPPQIPSLTSLHALTTDSYEGTVGAETHSHCTSLFKQVQFIVYICWTASLYSLRFLIDHQRFASSELKYPKILVPNSS